MKKRFTEEQMIKVVSRMEAGGETKEICRELGITPQTAYNWKRKYAGMSVSEARRLRELEVENGRLKRIVADLTLDNRILKEVNSKNW